MVYIHGDKNSVVSLRRRPYDKKTSAWKAAQQIRSLENSNTINGNSPPENAAVILQETIVKSRGK